MDPSNALCLWIAESNNLLNMVILKEMEILGVVVFVNSYYDECRSCLIRQQWLQTHKQYFHYDNTSFFLSIVLSFTGD